MLFIIRKLIKYNNVINGNIFDNKEFIMKVVNNYVKNKNIFNRGIYLYYK